MDNKIPISAKATFSLAMYPDFSLLCNNRFCKSLLAENPEFIITNIINGKNKTPENKTDEKKSWKTLLTTELFINEHKKPPNNEIINFGNPYILK
jgi:hypothetical protein